MTCSEKKSVNHPERETLVVKFNYYATESHELTVVQGERLTLLDDSLQWWKVINSSGEIGYVPSNYVRPVKQSLLTTLKNTLTRRKGSLCKLSKQQAPAVRKKHADSECQTHVYVPAVRTIERNQSREYMNSYIGRNIIHKTKDSATMEQVGLQKQNLDLTIQKSDAVEKNKFLVETNKTTRIKHTYNAGSSSPLAFESTFAPEMPTNVAPLGPTKSGEDILEDFCCQVVLPYNAQLKDELSIRPGDRLRVYKRSADGWWFGALLEQGRPTMTGWFPSNLVFRGQSNNPVRIPNKQYNMSSLLVPKATQKDGNTLRGLTESASPLLRAGHPHATVLTLYPFVSNQLDELSFEANELLEVIDQPVGNAYWWRCRNAFGDVGWVPRNHVELLSDPSGRDLSKQPTPDANSRAALQDAITMNVNCNVDSELRRLSYARRSKMVKRFLTKPWFWGALSRIECERMLTQFAVPGEFVIRDSESDPGNMSISVNTGEHNRNFKVRIVSGQYHIGWRIFDTMDELIHHYQTHVIYTDGLERYSLTRPFVHPGSPDIDVDQGALPYSSTFRPYDAANEPFANSVYDPGAIPLYTNTGVFQH